MIPSVLLLLAALIGAGIAFGGPLFVRTIRHRDGDVQRHWVKAGPIEIFGLAVVAVILLSAMSS